VPAAIIKASCLKKSNFMLNLLTITFWFNLRPGSLSGPFRNLLVLLIVVLLLAAIVLFIKKRQKSFYRHLYGNLYDFSLINALIGFLMLFFNYELIPFFSARFWYIIWLGIGVWWLFYVLQEIKLIKQRKKEAAQKNDIEKYLP
jgi:hypothetical protein